MEETAAKNIKTCPKSFEIFLEMFLEEKYRRHFGLKFYIRELYRYEYVRIPRKRERKTGVF